jgi:hypothetical protein
MKKALLIGINYRNTSNELTGCINDVNELKNVLAKNCGYNNITVISEDEKIKPTKNNILKALKDIISESEKYNEIWIHYSGHGYYVKDENGDEADGYDEVLVPLDHSVNGFIIDDDLNLIISKTKCNTYITFDCCHSGSALDLYYNLSIQKNKLIHSYELSKKNNKTSNKNIFMISGCMDDQTSEENKIQVGGNLLQVGAMTSTLIQVLRKYNFNITVGNLIMEMNKYLLRNKYRQIPVFSSNQTISLNKPFLTLAKNNSKREHKEKNNSKSNSKREYKEKNNSNDDLEKKIKKIIKKELQKLLKS